jgi:putative transposase
MYEVIKSAMKTKPQTIVLEDLNVKGMMQNPKLAKAIQEENLSEFRRVLTYKCKRNGTELIIADRWYPSSKTCSCCGNIKHNLKLSDRIYKCDICGLIMDRDENAAKNLERYPKIKYKEK